MDGNSLPTRLHVEASLALSVALLLSIPTVKHLISSFTKPVKQDDGVYEDEDGQSTPEDVFKFSTQVPRILVVIFASLGCLASAYLSVLGALYATQANLIAVICLYTAVWVRLVVANAPYYTDEIVTQNRPFLSSTHSASPPAETRRELMIWVYGSASPRQLCASRSWTSSS